MDTISRQKNIFPYFILIGLILTPAILCPAQDNLATVKPQEIDEPFGNPYMGWGIWAGKYFYDGRKFTPEYNTAGFGKDIDWASWVLIDWMWNDLEPQDGNFTWDEFDAVANYWRKLGKQLHVRLWVTSDPGWDNGSAQAEPDWLWEKKGIKFHEYKSAGSTHRQPDYEDPTYITNYLPELRKFLTTYRDRYLKSPGPPITNQVMGYGDWGEWHCTTSGYLWPRSTTDQKHERLARIIKEYVDIFYPEHKPGQRHPELIIAMMWDKKLSADAPLEEAMFTQALDVAVKEYGLGVSRHAFPNILGGWPGKLNAQYWRTNPQLGEANNSYESLKKQYKDGQLALHVDKMIGWHANYGHMYQHADNWKQCMAEDRAQVERALKPGGIGYRLVPITVSWDTKVKPGQPLTLKQTWVNRNAGYCSEPYRLKVYLTKADGSEVFSAVDAKFDPRSWFQGQAYQVESKFTLAENLPAGTYDLFLALVDESGTPQVRLGIAGMDNQKRYRLGRVEIMR